MNNDTAYLESLYNNRAAVPDFQACFDRWEAKSNETFRALRAQVEKDVPYGDDIMETMFQLAINGEWIYSDSDGRVQPLDQSTLDSLYVKRRLSEQDLQRFNGSWRPA